MAKLLAVPDDPQAVSQAMLEVLAAEAPDNTRAAHTSGQAKPDLFDLEAFMREHGLNVQATHERDGTTYRQTFSYDPLGRLATQGLPDGSRLVHGYDAQGRAEAFGLSMAGDAAVRWLARFVHRDAGASAMELGNAIRFEQSVDASGRPVMALSLVSERPLTSQEEIHLLGDQTVHWAKMASRELGWESSMSGADVHF